MRKGSIEVFLLCFLALAGDPALAQSNAVYYWRNFAGEPGVAGTNDGVGTNAQFHGPENVAVDGAGNVYVADTLNGAIRKITSDGTVTTLAGIPGVTGTNDGTGTNALFEYPYALALDGESNLYVVDLRGEVNGYLRKVTSAGAVTTLGFVGNAIYSMAIDSSTNIFWADNNLRMIYELTSSGVLETLHITTMGRAPFLQPLGLAFDNATNLYVVDGFNCAIWKLVLTGTNWARTLFAGDPGFPGSKDGTGSNALFEDPEGVAVDSATNLYVTDGFTIRKISSAGAVTTIGGAPMQSGTADGTNTAARFNGAVWLAVDNAGNVYVADYVNNRISKGTLLPPLNVVSSGTNVIVSWPSSFIAWTLQQNSDAGNPAGWIAASFPTSDDGTNKSISIPLPAGNLFFRLIGD
jgi:hypothetical protein